MSEPNPDPHVNGQPPAGDQAPPPKPVRLQVWPAVVIVLAQVITLAVAYFLPTIMGQAMTTAATIVLTAVLLSLWWLFWSRVPWADRFIGLLLFVAAFIFILFTHPREHGQFFFFAAAPILTTGTIIVLAATMAGPWKSQRFKAIVFMFGCAVLFSLLRVEDVSSNLFPILKWRWTASSEDLLAKSVPATSPGGKAEVPEKPGPMDWPGFRGADRDGIVKGVTISTNWNEKPPKELWRKRVGLGFSSFAAIGDYIFTQEQRKENEVVVCYKASTGEEVWINSVKSRFEDTIGDGPRATPAFDGGKLYAQGAKGHLQCLDAATGDVVWKTDVASDTGAHVPQWGFASSPLVTDKYVIVFTGGPGNKAVIAYDKSNGAKAWCGGAGTHGYSSAHLAHIDGTPQIVMLSDFGAQGLEPETGAVLWQDPWQTKMNTRVVQPTIIDGKAVLVGTAEGKGTRYLQVARSDSGWSAKEKWTTREFRPYFNDYVLHRGYLYGFDGNMLVCVDANSGKRRWKGNHYGGQVLLVENSNVLIVLTEQGELALVNAEPSEFKEIAKFQAIRGKTWNHPVIAHGKLFVRNAEEMACYELPAS